MHTDVEPCDNTTGSGVAALITAAVLWSFGGPLVKVVSHLGVSGLSLAFYRSLLGAIVLVPWAWRRRRDLLIAHPGWIAGSVVAFTVMTACFIGATVATAASSAIVLQYTAPIWVFLLSPMLLNERPQPKESLFLLISMAGVAATFLLNGGGAVAGLVIALLSGVGYGGLIIALRGLRAMSPLLLVWVNCAGSALLLTPVVLRWSTFHLNGRQAGWICLIGLAQFAAPYVIFSWAIARIAAYRASLLLLIEPPLNAFWTYSMIGEPVPAGTTIGGPLILAGVAGWLWAQRRAELQGTKEPP